MSSFGTVPKDESFTNLRVSEIASIAKLVCGEIIAEKITTLELDTDVLKLRGEEIKVSAQQINDVVNGGGGGGGGNDPNAVKSIGTNSGTAQPIAGTVIIEGSGANNITTSAVGDTITIAVSGTTNNAIQIGNAAGSLTSVGPATNGQLLIGSTGAAPVLATLTSTGGSINITNGPGSINLETIVGPAGPTFVTGTGNAVPAMGVINFPNGSNIETSGAASTVTIDLVDSPSVSGTVTAGNGLVVTAGGINNTGGLTNAGGITNTGGLTSAGATRLSSLIAGVVAADALGNLASVPTINNAVQIGNAASSITSIPVATNGQVLLGSTAAAPVFSTLTSSNGSITFTPGPGTLSLQASGATANSFVTGSGNATPAAGVLNVPNGSNINTTGAGNTLTIDLVNSPSVTGSLTAGTSVAAGTTVSAGSSISAGTTVTAATGLVATTGGLTVSAGGITSTGTTTLNSLGAGILTTNGGGVVTNSATTNNAVQLGNATGTLTSAAVGTNGQVLIGSTAAAPVFSTLTSTNGSISFTPGPGTLSLQTSGATANSFVTGSGNATPAAGILNVPNGSNINTTGAGNTMTVNLVNSPSVSGSLTAGTTVSAGTAVSAGTTVTAATGLVATTGGLTVGAGGITSTGTTTLNSLGAGVLTTNGGGVVTNSATTNNAVQIGNAAGTLSSTVVGNTGQVLAGRTGTDPTFLTLISGNASININAGPATIDFRSGSSVASEFVTDSGSAIPASGILLVPGSTNITTSGSGNTLDIQLTNSILLSGSVTAGTTVNAGTGVNVTSGGVNVDAGGITNIGGLTSSGATTLTDLGAGIVSTDGAGLVSSTATTTSAVQVGNASGTLTSLGVGTNGQVLVGSTGLNPTFSTLTSSNGSISFTPGAGTLSLQTSGATANSFAAGTGTATPAAGILSVPNGSNINTTGAGNVLTVSLVNSPSVSGSLTAGTTVAAGTTVTGGTGVIATTGNVAVTAGNVTMPATSSTAGQIIMGGVRQLSAFGINNTFVGASGNLTTTGNNVVAVGSNAAIQLTTGNNLVAVGRNAGTAMQTTMDSVVVGSNVGMAMTGGQRNFGIGTATMAGLTTGEFNVAIGYNTLNTTSTGKSNIAIGTFAERFGGNVDGNIGIGTSALAANTTGDFNVVVGHVAASTTTMGSGNVIVGSGSANNAGAGNLINNVIIGSNSVSSSAGALSTNVVIGASAGSALGGGSTSNIVIGPSAGSALVSGNNSNIVIGTAGVAGNSGTYIGNIFGATSAAGIPVLINASGQLGTTTSSERFKKNIKSLTLKSKLEKSNLKDVKDMKQSSLSLNGLASILDLNPVEFTFKNDATNAKQIGLIAEEVFKSIPELVVLDKDGLPYTVKYQDLPTLILLELKRMQTELTAVSEFQRSTLSSSTLSLPSSSNVLVKELTDAKRDSLDVENLKDSLDVENSKEINVSKLVKDNNSLRYEIAALKQEIAILKSSVDSLKESLPIKTRKSKK